MIPISDSKFTKLESNKDILFFELTNNSMISAFSKDISKEDTVVLVKVKTKNKQNDLDLEAFKKKILSENKTLIIVEDV